MRRTSKLPPVKEVPAEESFAERTREDFVLERRIGKRTWLVYERNKRNVEEDYKGHVLQDCEGRDWTVPRARLVDIAREHKSLVPTHFVFPHEEGICIVSRIADICLADIVDGSSTITEEHTSAILTQVSLFDHL
jgi:hypothetical protein